MKLTKPKFWDYNKPNFLSYLLLPFSLPLIINNFLLKKKRKDNFSRIFKICFGNIYLGGTGKTPISIKTNNLLNNNKYESVLIKKLYKDQIDEQKMIRNYTNLICKNSRSEAIKEALKQNFKFAVFDDGLQDKSIIYDLKIVCFNLEQWIGNGQLIPAGPMREKISSLKKYDAIILNGKSSDKNEIISNIKNIKKNINIFETEYKIKNISSFNLNNNYVIFSGIGNPSNFVNLLKNNNFKVIKNFNFPDHYNYKKIEIEKIIKFAFKNNSQVITTEKDYYRLNKKYAEQINFVQLELEIKNQNNFLNFIKNEKI